MSINEHNIYINSDGTVKINILQSYDDGLCKICLNRSELRKEGDLSTCAYCHGFDMFWLGDQETSMKVLKDFKKSGKVKCCFCGLPVNRNYLSVPCCQECLDKHS